MRPYVKAVPEEFCALFCLSYLPSIWRCGRLVQGHRKCRYTIDQMAETLEKAEKQAGRSSIEKLWPKIIKLKART